MEPSVYHWIISGLLSGLVALGGFAIRLMSKANKNDSDAQWSKIDEDRIEARRKAEENRDRISKVAEDLANLHGKCEIRHKD